MKRQGLLEFDFWNGFLRWCFKRPNGLLRWYFKGLFELNFEMAFWNHASRFFRIWFFKWLFTMMLQKAKRPFTMMLQKAFRIKFWNGFLKSCFKVFSNLIIQMAFYDDASKGFSNAIFKWLFKMKRQGLLEFDLRNLRRYIVPIRDFHTRVPYDFHMRFLQDPLNRNLGNLRRYMVPIRDFYTRFPCTISIRDFHTRFPYTISRWFPYAISIHDFIISARSAESKFAKLAPAFFGEANFRHVANELDRGGPRRKRIRQANREATRGAKFRGKQIYATSQTN